MICGSKGVSAHCQHCMNLLGHTKELVGTELAVDRGIFGIHASLSLTLFLGGFGNHLILAVLKKARKLPYL